MAISFTGKIRINITKITRILGIVIKTLSLTKTINQIGEMNGLQRNNTIIDARELAVLIVTVHKTIGL
jgi:hypothetical protein